MELPMKKNSRKRNSTSSETAGLPTKKKYCRKKKNISWEEKTVTTMYVPNDVMAQILSKLPPKSLLRLRWVCKYWFTSITDPYFVKMHLNNVNATSNPLVMITRYKSFRCLEFGSLNSLDDKRPIYMKVPESLTSDKGYVQNLGSCNGLFCIRLAAFESMPFHHDKIFIWNPCTREYKMIWRDDDSVRRPRGSFAISYGFGYDCSIDDYKVIRHLCTSNTKTSLVDVYTVGTNSSKKLPSRGFFFPDRTSGLFVNGDLYWIAYVKSLKPNSSEVIVAFDVAKEEYRQITKPHINYAESYRINLGKIKGCLCVLNVATNRTSVEVWVMKHNVDDMKREYSWDVLYTISTGQSKRSRTIRQLKPVSFCKNGEIAMLTYDREFILYNPKTNQVKFLRKFHYFVTVESYIESLVSVKGGTYMGQEP